MSAAQAIGRERHLLLIDISGILRAAWHASGDQEVSAAATKTLEKVAAVRSMFGRGHAVACLDAPPYARRLAMLATYKGQREKPSEVMIEQFRRVRARLEQDGLLFWRHAGEEADDLIGSAVARAKAEGFAVTIVSSDKDLLVLVDDEAGVDVYSPFKNKLYRREDVIAEWGVSPDMLLDSLALQGDTSDNVPSLPGVGPKTAAKLLLEFGSFDAVFANADKITKPKLQEAVANHGDAARLARKVIALRTDIPVPWEQLFEERKPVPLAPVDYNNTPDAEFDPISPPKPAAPKATDETPTVPAEEAPKATAAIVPVAAEWSMQLEPNSLGAAQALAKGLFNSRLYPKFPTWEAIWAVIIRGREMGISAATALDSLSFFEGKVNVGAHLLIARAKEHPDCEYFQFVGGDDTYAEWETKNRKNPGVTRLKYTIEQAKLAGLVRDKGNWVTRPAEMLRKTGGVQLARLEYPGALHDAYALEEMGDR